ncbi:MAG: sugar transferase [Candidatus Omnitrophica bacterium]|nr:sugar transferase [Candidatus Omnitrophota bacterium]
MRSARAFRVFDIAVSLLTLVMLFPILALVAFWIKCVSRGPIFYTQERVGKNGGIFTIYKFRTMRHDAEQATGIVWAKKGDPRLIKGGKFLKDTHLDEVPQFFNVLKGDMSVVGPRPERPSFVTHFKTIITGYDDRLRTKPGITGLSQITFEYDKSIEDVKRKLEKDREYIANRSIFLDALILFRTFLVVITGRLRPIRV